MLSGSRLRPASSPALLRVIYFALYLVVCWTFVAWMAAGLFPGAALAVVALALYTAVPIFVFLSRRGWAFYPGALFRVAVVRVLLYTQGWLVLTVVAGVLGVLLGLPFGSAHAGAQLGALATTILSVVVCTIGYFGSRALVTREVHVDVPSLPVEFDGLRIAQISDMHVGPQIPAAFLARVVRTVHALAPDLIAVTGDQVDDRAEDVSVYARALGSLTAPLGVFMIPGNHDVYAGWAAVEAGLRREVPGTLLVNESRVLRRGDATITIVGTGDPAGAHWGKDTGVAPDIARAYAGVPTGNTVIALAHNPALWPALVKRGAALTLSGHTHWGQFAIPSRNWNLAGRFQPYSMGAYAEGGSTLYINPGTGYWGLPFRIGARPEITLVTLHRAATTAIRMSEVTPAA